MTDQTAAPLSAEEEAKARHYFGDPAPDRDNPMAWREWANSLSWKVGLYGPRLLATLDAARSTPTGELTEPETPGLPWASAVRDDTFSHTMTMAEALEMALDVIQAELEVIGEPEPGKQQNYEINGVKMAHATTFADDLAQARSALATPREADSGLDAERCPDRCGGRVDHPGPHQPSDYLPPDVLAARLAAGVHDLTTSIEHKRLVLGGARDECEVIGRALTARLRKD